MRIVDLDKMDDSTRTTAETVSYELNDAVNIRTSQCPMKIWGLLCDSLKSNLINKKSLFILIMLLNVT